MVRELDFYPGGPGSNPIGDVGFFQTMHHVLFTNFHIRKSLVTHGVQMLGKIPTKWRQYPGTTIVVDWDVKQQTKNTSCILRGVMESFYHCSLRGHAIARLDTVHDNF